MKEQWYHPWRNVPSPVVKYAFVIVGPGHAAEFDVFEHVFQILSGFDVFEFDFDPVGAALTESVGEQSSIVGERRPGECDLRRWNGRKNAMLIQLNPTIGYFKRLVKIMLYTEVLFIANI